MVNTESSLFWTAFNRPEHIDLQELVNNIIGRINYDISDIIITSDRVLIGVEMVGIDDES